MGKAMFTGFALLAVAVAVSGCADFATTAPVLSVQQECERSGGVWRSESCERASGGGGGGY